MSLRDPLAVSVVLPFNDDEEVIGTLISRIADHLREHGETFEIIAVDEYSGDNSHAILGVLRRDLPELRVVHAGARGRGFDCGAKRAQGEVLWLVEPALAKTPLSSFNAPYARIRDGQRDLIVVKDRFAVARRRLFLDAAAGLKGRGAAYWRRLSKRAANHRLAVDTLAPGGSTTERANERPWTRLFDAIASERAPWSRVGDRSRW